eukprot:2017917-Amphidinium_carterae.1
MPVPLSGPRGGGNKTTIYGNDLLHTEYTELTVEDAMQMLLQMGSVPHESHFPSARTMLLCLCYDIAICSCYPYHEQPLLL